ncbi:hypothetical protein HMPREF9141_1955 [Prevotella multiformis DSM 16608]|uniref:Uncharacterized protein n=1 Tax=Prevotella multiformis DSM 16608 TaxID=888743 RepID=F0F8N8_9BACT|nr:hypothetical protein HMPREF9141_1955 [Prevotella multiformis DSM 16608]
MVLLPDRHYIYRRSRISLQDEIRLRRYSFVLPFSAWTLFVWL